MNADEYRQKAQYFITRARQITRLANKAVMIVLAAFWMGKAEQAEQQQT
jgi:hypothetical protein